MNAADSIRSSHHPRLVSFVSWLRAGGAALVLLGLAGVGCGGGTAAKSDAGTTSGTGGAGTIKDGGTTTGKAADLGKACATDAECGSGMTCLTATGKMLYGGGGPSNGYCSVKCTTPFTGANTGGDATCAALGATCLDFGTPSVPAPYCVQNCVMGAVADQSTKCQGRPDVACVPSTSDAASLAGFCNPLCGADSDCPTGRKCHPYYWICVDSSLPVTGTPLGSACTYNADPSMDTCAGECFTLRTGSTVGVCTQYCVAGNPTACNINRDATMSVADGTHGVCFPGADNGDAGDLGYCIPECDTAASCAYPTDPKLTCDQTFKTQINHGLCSWGA